MKDKTCKVFIDNVPFEFNVKGDFFWGVPKVLYQEKDNVISKVPWKEDGYSVVEAFSTKEFAALRQSITKNIVKAIRAVGVEVGDDFTLEKYHELIKDDQVHFEVVKITRDLKVEDFDFDIDALADRFGAVLGYSLTSWVEELQRSHIQIRISRPNSLDINPPHRDGYLSYWENIINIWVPICGCNAYTSLPVVPGSHLIPENEILRTESKGAIINGNVYYVPCILETKQGSFQMIRPNPKEGEALLFSPFLIHGSAINQSKNITRVALELRFPKKD